MPIAREVPKRKASEVAVPSKGNDPAERKRILNILAQRRYRQRRKQHVKSLEAQAGRRQDSEAFAHSPTQDTSSIQPETTPLGHGDLPGSEVMTPTLDAFASTDFDFQPPPQPEQGQLFDDPFAMFDPNFVAFPTDLEPWNPDLPSISNSPYSTTDPSNLSLTSPESSSHTPTDAHYFPDEANLEVLELSLLRAAVSIAKRLNIEELIWSLTSTSPFTTAMASPFSVPSASTQFGHLPSNLQPTVIQLSQPHHPIFDLLPWPTVRDKLILVFTQPPEIRPTAAKSPTALLEFVYDIEDSAEGVRIWGDDPHSDQSWEVGEKVFNNWWWAFDGDVIRRSNEMRKRRGARLLGMQGSVLGEVQ